MSNEINQFSNNSQQLASNAKSLGQLLKGFPGAAFKDFRNLLGTTVKNVESSADGIENFNYGSGLAFYHDKFTHKHHVWHYELKKINKKAREYKCVFNLLYEGDKKTTLKELKSNADEFKKSLMYKYPVFELSSVHNLDLDQTLVPIFKRKIMNHVFQSVSHKEFQQDV